MKGSKSPKFSDFYANSLSLSLRRARIYFLCVIYLNSMQQQQNILFVYSHAKHNYPFSHKSIAYYHEDFFIFLKNREKQKKKFKCEMMKGRIYRYMQCVHNHAIMLLLLPHKWLLMQLCITFDGVIFNYVMK